MASLDAAQSSSTHSDNGAINRAKNPSARLVINQVNDAVRQSIDRLGAAQGVRQIIVETLIAMDRVMAPLGSLDSGFAALNETERSLRVETLVCGGQEVPIEGTTLDADWPVDEPPMVVPWNRLQSEDFLWGLTSDPGVLVPEVRGYHESRGARAVAYQVLRRGDRAIGFIATSLRSDEPPTSQQVRLMRALATYMTIAVEFRRVADSDRIAAATDARDQALAEVSAVLHDSFDRLTAGDGLDEFLAAVLTIASEKVGASHAFVFEYDRPRHQLTLRHSFLEGRARRGVSTDEVPLWGAPFGADITPAWELMCRERQVFTSRMISIDPAKFAWPGALEYLQRRGASDASHQALFVGQKPVGSLRFTFLNGRRLRESDRPFLLAVGQQLAAAMQLVQMGERARDAAVAREKQQAAEARSEQLTKANAALRRSIERLADEKDLTLMLDSFLEEAVRAIGGVGGGLLLRVPETRCSFRVAAAYEARSLSLTEIEADPHLGSLAELSGADPHGIFSALARGEQPSILADTLRDLLPSAYAYHRRRGHRMIWHAPLRLRAEVVGYLGIGLRDEREPDAGQRETLETLTQQLVLAIEMNRLAGEAQRAAIERDRDIQAQMRAAELMRANDALQATIDVLPTVDGLERFIPAVLEIVASSFDAPSCAYYEHRSGDLIHLRYWRHDRQTLGPTEMLSADLGSDLSFVRELAAGFELPPDLRSLNVRQRTHAVIVNHELTPGRLGIDLYCAARQWVLELNVPLVVGGVSEGAMVLRRRAGRPFLAGEIALAETMGKQLAFAIQMDRLAKQRRADAAARIQEQSVSQERAKMAREIHDNLAQGYAAILVNLQSFKMGNAAVLQGVRLSEIEVIERLAKDNLLHARRTMDELRRDPFERIELMRSLSSCVEREHAFARVQVELHGDMEHMQLPRYVESEVCRIVQEALANVRRHARIGTALVRVQGADGTIKISVIDRGIEFDPIGANDSFGLKGMRERAARAGGELDIFSEPGQGTEVRVTISAW